MSLHSKKGEQIQIVLRNLKQNRAVPRNSRTGHDFTTDRGASKGGVVGVSTPALFGKEGNFALFSSGQSSRMLNVLFE